MNLFTTKLRRGATVVGGTILGLGIVASMAAPALACATLIKTDAKCGTDGGWVATFKVANDWNGGDAHIATAELDGVTLTASSPLGEIYEGALAPKAAGKYNGFTWLTGTVSEKKTTDSATLKIKLFWDDKGYVAEKTATVNKPDTDCGPTTTPPTEPTGTPTTTPPTEPTGTPTTEPTGTPTTSPTAPPTTEVPLPTPSGSTEPVLPDEIFAVDCDSMTIGLDNTKGEIEYKLHFEPSTGAAKDLDIKAGEKESVTFDASEGFSVKLTIVAIFKGETSEPETVTIPYETPADCGGEGGGLPVTGAAAGGIAGGAAVLLAAGAVLFMLARRRKVRFTA